MPTDAVLEVLAAIKDMTWDERYAYAELRVYELPLEEALDLHALTMFDKNCRILCRSYEDCKERYERQTGSKLD
jgi:hypothetical protein